MFNIIEKKISWNGKELSLQTGKIARQADGAVVAKYGETQVLATVVFSKEPSYDLDFFPLTVNYQDKYSSVGKIPGGFLKREAKPSEREILISRLIDRPLRPLFDEKLRNEVQIVVSTLSYDKEAPVDILSILAASAALSISGFPIDNIVAATKVGFINGEFVANPSSQTLKSSSLDLVVAGVKEGILMVESEAHELSEETMLQALKFGHENFMPVIDLIGEFKDAVSKNNYLVDLPSSSSLESLSEKITVLIKDDLEEAFSTQDKQERTLKIEKARIKVKENLESSEFEEEFLGRYFDYCFKTVEKQLVRNNILENSIRIDGRTLTQVRRIETETDIFTGPHGSALFTRGETQALVFATLGTEIDEQIIDDIENAGKERFMLHYNFPAFSVGEVGRIGFTGRREIGHGKLAWRAINPLLPSKEDFPYTIRVVSDITESNGSSSMATVCGSSMALMSAGVPIEKTIAGIAMGLIKEKENFAVLTDILGDEDHLGDMDFKVAGTQDGITSLQMDIKITSITYDIMEQAMEQAKEGRKHIISEMIKTISSAKKEMSSTAPKIQSLSIDKEKIKDVIGSGGKVIKEISEKFSVKVDISNEGVVKVFGTISEKVDEAIEYIKSIVIVPEVGKTYQGKVVKILEFGAFVNFIPNKDGFLHISEITDNRKADINDFLQVGDVLEVKIVDIDNRNRIRLTMKI